MCRLSPIYGCGSLGAIWCVGMLSSCICSSLVSVCAMEGIPIGPLAQWGKDLTYYLTPSFCLVNWGMYYPGSACRGTDLPPGRILYTHTSIVYQLPLGLHQLHEMILYTRPSCTCRLPLWSRSNIVSSHLEGPRLIPGRVSFPGWSFSGGFPQS